MAKARALAFRVLAERIEHDEGDRSPSPSPLREFLAFVEGRPCTCGALADRLESQAPIRLTQDPLRVRLA